MSREICGLCRVQWVGRWGVLGSLQEARSASTCVLQKYPEHAIHKVLQLMLRRGEIQHRLQRKVLYRLK